MIRAHKFHCANRSVIYASAKRREHKIDLLSNSENREHLKNFRNVDCVLAKHKKVQDAQANLKTTN